MKTQTGARAAGSWQQRCLASSWCPCTRMRRAAHVPPRAMVRGKKSRLFDETGRRYVDTGNSGWFNLFDYTDARFGAALGHCFTPDTVGQHAR